MLFLIALAISFCIAFFGSKALKKYPMIFYFAAAIITVVVIIINQGITNRTITIESEFVRKYLIGIFSKGAFAGALWCIVMWVGALSSDTKAGKKLVSTIMPVRGELSVFAAVVTLSHAVTYGITYLKRFNLLKKNNISFPSDFILTCIICIILLVIMIPLAVMSLKAIRRKMKPKTWKNIQRSAYVFYALILIHVLVLYIPQAKKGISDRYISVIVYTAVFAGYAVMRFRKLYIRKKKPEKKLVLNIVSGAIFAAAVAAVSVYSYGKAPTVNIPAQTVTNTVVETQTTTSAAESNDNENEKAVTTTVEGQTTQTTATDVTDYGETTTTTTDADEDSDDNGAASETQANEDNIDEQEYQEEEAQAPQNGSQQQEEQQKVQSQEQPQQQEQTTSAPEPVYIYNNGTFKGKGTSPSDFEGKDYEGTVYADVTIENDVITNITLQFPQDDAEYYTISESYIINQILGKSNADGVDTVCGATRSAEGALQAIQNALNSARK